MAKFAAYVTFSDPEKRLATVDRHRAYLRDLLSQGKLHESGPFADGKGALIIYEVADEAEARALLDADPYTPAGVLADVQLREWNRVLP